MVRSEPIGFSLAGGLFATVTATAVASLLFTPGQVRGRLLVMAIAVGGQALRTPRWPAALATAVLAWLLATGFLVNTEAELTLDDHDLLRLFLLLLIAALAAGVRTVADRLSLPSAGAAGAPGTAGAPGAAKTVESMGDA
ncbi:hypothetical protein ABZ470_36050 [Streptosporangium sp. NPDC020072]|uniref:hypothetical protein n=1 Tax=Streptosporangium sp. NPDC020072 TaxID=3154788 RepID=UPI003415B9B8